MPYNPARALELLRLGTQNPAATFHDGQEEAIRHVVDGRGRLLVVQKTGWGKSSVYFIANKLLREEGLGPAILISPLLALMRNQIAAAERMGVRAVTIHSGNRDDWPSIEGAITRNEVDILLIHPKRLMNDQFNTQVLARIAATVSLVVIDEAHCISDWGHDFVPEYRLIERRIRLLPANVRVLATTATANNRVMADLQAVLGPYLAVSRGDLSRSSLLLQTMRMPSQAERLAWLATHLPIIPGSGIIYALTQRDAERVAEWLRLRGLAVEAYHSDLSPERTNALEDALLANQVKALVATTKLGMGFDKPDLAFVIHYQTPGSVVAYYQQVGRAGRNLPPTVPGAYGVLLSGTEETDITNFFIDSAFPSRSEVRSILDAIRAEANGLSVNGIMERVNIRYGRIEKALLLLSLESPAPIAKQDSKWTLTAANLSEEFWHRAERLTALRQTEQAQMQEYVQLQRGLMEYLIRALDGDPGLYRVPNLAPLSSTVDRMVAREAVAFLRRTSLPLEPRKKWPPGGLASLGVRGNTNITPERSLQPGKVLCRWGDAGWGEMVRLGKYRDQHFADDLVNACVVLLREWSPTPAPQWVTCIPSLRHLQLVPNFALRLAAAINLPFHPVLIKTDHREPQKEMENAAYKARNVDGSIAVQGNVPTGPVLLIDDMVDSKWTLTVAAYLLTSNGSGPVYPLALASTANSDE
ncbi:MAG: RecQ family ATP-dependent DNA helicase [Undibacterium sp.]|nr:RecQ family ATP-dependent DNA helicase [Opitutaceae bacterium]